MKKSIIAKSLLITSMVFTSVSANAAEQEPLTTWEKAGVFSSTIIVGTIAGGPIGLVLGVAAGDWINNTWDKSIESDKLVAENQQIAENLLASELQNNQLQQDVLILDQQIQQISETEELNQQLVLNALQLDLLFAVNQSVIDATNQARLTQIADYLIEHDTINIVLSGHADPSGQDELNINLAQQRAVAVQDNLIALGVNESNIQVQSFGAEYASSELGDLVQYPRDRKVTIEFIDSLADSATNEVAMQF
ncbi:OmpA family protein [Moritella sp. 24]|uniref:OmpA family protein n=1 Tax=Moritella sp. 24 TaxID=2746230 RepID=UPI001BAC0479|nr:OmpA family protein [Moritella sp. 24]QUM77629.1 OmpA family protein [Moritella sp. 24]